MNDKLRLSKNEKSWILYDCANSAYALAISTALFPVYFGMMKAGNSMDLGYFNSAASVVIAFMSPILGTIADYKDYKKRFFMFFAFMGMFMTLMLAMVPSGQWFVLAIIYILSAIGFSGANIFYDAFLVDVSTNENMDSVSTKGFAFGYIVSVIPFIISLGIVFIMGMDKMIGFQLSFVITALWWGTFTIPMIKNVKQVHYIEREKHPIINSYKRISETIKSISQYRTVVIFIIAYFLYIDGVDTIIKMAVPYSTETLGLDSSNMFMLLAILLVIQIIAFPCALVYGILAKRFKAKRMIIFAIFTYLFAIVFAFFMTELWHIFILGGLIGSAQGGIQALSRSYYAKIIPKDKANQFFGFYNVFGKFAAIIGPWLMAFTTTVTGVARYSILSIIPLFVIGLIVFMFLPADAVEAVQS